MNIINEILPNFLRKDLENIFNEKELEIIHAGFSEENKGISIRINNIKSNIDEVVKDLKENNIDLIKQDYLENGYLVENKELRDLWNTESYKKGHIYLQDFSSQFAVELIGKSDERLNILDATSAPGGKTSYLAERFPNSKIIATELSKVRFEKMIHNLNKLGVTNVKRYNGNVNSKEFMDDVCMLEEIDAFDIILIDAPCSGEGNIKYSRDKSFKNINIKSKKVYSQKQKDIFDSCVNYLKSGGEIIYSTCTLNTFENEEIVNYVLNKHSDLDITKFNIPDNNHLNLREGFTARYTNSEYTYDDSLKNSLRVLPYKTNGGFFISKLIKK